MKIVIIDDEPELREVIRKNLEIDQHEVTEAGDGFEGLRKIKLTRPDLIISDVKMPGIDGVQMLNLLRADPSDISLIPCVFLSANVDEADKINLLNNGLDACFEKPIPMKLLRAHVNAALANSRRQGNFLQRKMNAIAKSLSQSVHYDFNQYKSLSHNVEEYVSIICEAVDSKVNTHIGTLLESQLSVATKLTYIKNSLNIVELVRDLHRPQNAEMLSWWLILSVSESHYANRPIYVSDLYTATLAAKSTIIVRIQLLVDDGVFEKISALEDGRRQSINLSENFLHDMDKHIVESITIYRNILS
ncbi:MAG: DNA-binding response OmpR family regulator [Gammaproteobacteria bacterium]